MINIYTIELSFQRNATGKKITSKVSEAGGSYG